MKEIIRRKTNLPNMVSRFIANDCKELSIWLHDREIDELKRYLYEYDIQVEVIEDETTEKNKKTPINYFNRKNGKKNHKIEKTGIALKVTKSEPIIGLTFYSSRKVI